MRYNIGEPKVGARPLPSPAIPTFLAQTQCFKMLRTAQLAAIVVGVVDAVLDAIFGHEDYASAVSDDGVADVGLLGPLLGAATPQPTNTEAPAANQRNANEAQDNHDRVALRAPHRDLGALFYSHAWPSARTLLTLRR